MKRRTRFPADLMGLLVVPVFVITAVGMIASWGMWLLNWLAAHH